MRDSSNRSKRRWGALAAVGLLLPLLGIRASAEDPLKPVLGEAEITLPNLVPNMDAVSILYSYLDPETEEFIFGKPYLYFDTRAQNLGTVPVQLTLDGVPSLEDMAATPVAQCVAWTERVCRKQESVGGFVWHEPHTHWHYEEFAKYELRRLEADGRPDYSAAGLVAVSEKVSFCFIDSEQVRDDGQPAPVYNTCLPAVQGISPGWTDIYDMSLPGQQFPIEALTDGRYAVVIDMDYANRLFETNDDDNYIEATIEISGGLTQVSIVDRLWPAPGDRGTTTTTSSTTTTTTKLEKKPKHNS